MKYKNENNSEIFIRLGANILNLNEIFSFQISKTKLTDKNSEFLVKIYPKRCKDYCAYHCSYAHLEYFLTKFQETGFFELGCTFDEFVHELYKNEISKPAAEYISNNVISNIL